MRSIILRADGNKSNSYDRVFGLIVIAELLCGYYYKIFYTESLTDFVLSIINDLCNRVITAKDDRLNKKFSHIVGNQGVVILNGCNFDIKFQEEIKKTGAKLIRIDDFVRHQYCVGVIINHTPGITADYVVANLLAEIGNKYNLKRMQLIQFVLNNHPRIFEINKDCYLKTAGLSLEEELERGDTILIKTELTKAAKILAQHDA